MEIYQLRTFVAVAQQGHLTQAAEILHLSQPAVTAQIKALEEEMGMPLFARTTNGVILSKAGEHLLPEAERILSAARQMQNEAMKLKGQLTGKLKIGTISSPDILRLGEWFGRIAAKHPLLELSTIHGISSTVIHDVRKKTFDAGFYFGKNPYLNVGGLRLGEAAFLVAGPIAWADQIRHATPKEMGKFPWIGSVQASSHHKLSAELWRDLNISPKRIFEVDQEKTMLNLVEAGLGLCLLRDQDALNAAKRGKVFIWEPGRKTADLLFIYPADRRGDPLLEAIMEELREVWKEHATFPAEIQLDEMA